MGVRVLLLLLLLLLVAVLSLAHSGGGAEQRFWWISDIHMDAHYAPQASPSTFCHTADAPALGRSMRETPIRGSAVGWARAGNHSSPWGQYGCDPPQEMVESALDFMLLNNPSPSFLVMGGDFSAHYSDSLSLVQSQISSVTEIFTSRFPNTTMFFALGNDDFYPDYDFEENDVQFQWLYTRWQSILPPSAKDTFLRGGYYSSVPMTGLRMVVLNSVVYSTHHQVRQNARARRGGARTTDDEDPLGQFAFLRQELMTARINKQAVYILSHIPLGGDNYNQKPFFVAEYMTTMKGILLEFQDVIVAMLSGHTHQDDFRLLYTDGEATVVDILSPSISTSNSNNPSVREVVFSPQLGYELLDWRQYIFDLYQANILNSPTWLVEYDLLMAYEMMDGPSPRGFQQLARALESDVRVFNQWSGFYATMFHPKRAEFRCAHLVTDNAAYAKCIGDIQ